MNREDIKKRWWDGNRKWIPNSSSEFIDEISLFAKNEIFEVMVDCFIRINCYEYSSLFEVTNRVYPFSGCFNEIYPVCGLTCVHLVLLTLCSLPQTTSAISPLNCAPGTQPYYSWFMLLYAQGLLAIQFLEFFYGIRHCHWCLLLLHLQCDGPWACTRKSELLSKCHLGGLHSGLCPWGESLSQWHPGPCSAWMSSLSPVFLWP